MHRSPRRFRQRALAAASIALFSAQAGLPAAAQDSMPPPTPATSIAPALPSLADQVRLQELARLYAQLDRQRAGNRRWLGPTITLALGIVTLVAGGTLISDSVNNEGEPPCDDDNQPCRSEYRKGYAGLALVLIGPALLSVSVPLLIVRGNREARLRATETAIRRLGGPVSLAPTFSPRGEVGLKLHARF